MDSPRVSVVLPTFNRARELSRSIASVLAQTYRDLELIVVDDASTDETEEVVKAFEDRRVSYKKLPHNVGGAEARNVGIRMARGEIVAFQDSDDEWTCSKLERSFEKLQAHPSISGVFSDFVQIWESGCRLMPYSGTSCFRPDLLYDSLLWRNVVGTPTLVVKKSVLAHVGGFDSSMPRYQDWELALRLAQVAKLEYIKNPLVLSYVTEDSVTHDQGAHPVALQKIYDKHVGSIEGDLSLKAAWLYRLGDAKMAVGDQVGRRLLFYALTGEPFNIRYFAKLLLALPGSRGVYNRGVNLLRGGK